MWWVLCGLGPGGLMMMTRIEQGAACWCLTCRPIKPLSDPLSVRMALCPICGNKRCPRANDHRHACTGSNEPGQPGSSWEHVPPVGAALEPKVHPLPPSAYVNGADISADDKPATVVRKLDSRFHGVVALRAPSEVMPVTDNPAASHWHSLYREAVQQKHDDAARLGAQIVALEGELERMKLWKAAASAALVAADLCMDAIAAMQLDAPEREPMIKSARETLAMVLKGGA